MPDYLPSIDIAVSRSPATAIRDLATIAEHSGRFTVERHENVMGEEGFHVANLRYRRESPHKELGAQLISRNDLKNRVAVEMRAIEWEPDPPTNEAYCQAARDVVGPILSAYNSVHGTRYRLRIPSRKTLEPKLSAASSKHFNRFVVLANTSSLHPLDWERFYEFVWRSRSRPLHKDDMARLLTNHGFSKQYAERIAVVYMHLAAFKSLR